MDTSPRECPVCSKRFTPRAANQVYCTGAKGKCYRRAQNARQRGRPLVRGEVGLPFDCAHCSTRCVPGENVAPHATKFCGYDCKAAWHHVHVDGPQRRRESRRRRVLRSAASAAVGDDRTTRRWVAGPCEHCGEPFVSRWHPLWPARYCSDRCLRRASDGHRARARRFGVAYEPISRAKVLKGDDYRCQLCGCQTKRGAVVPDPLAPTLDHIVPMSRGGPHLYSNVQTACFECNWRKAASLAGEQLTLVA